MTLGNQPIGAVLLGAGLGRRFGSDKRLALLDQRTVAETTTRVYAGAFEQLRIVLRPGDTALGKLLAPYGQIVFAEQAHLGMGHSLAAGFTDLSWRWAFVGLLDMPFVGNTTLAPLRQRAGGTERYILRPRLHAESDAGPHGHPMGFHHSLFAEITLLQGDTGARSLLRAYASDIEDVVFSDTGIVRDIDKPEDLPRRQRPI